MMLALVLLLEFLLALSVMTARARIRLAADDRLAIEGALVAASAVAETRVAEQGVLAGLADGDRLALGWTVRPDGWRWRADLVREGVLVRLEVVAERRAPAGPLLAARRLTLLLHHAPSDTVRVLTHRARR
jgi:hypothetical protein